MKNPALKRMPADLKTELKKLHRLVLKSKGVLITGHINPDGDDISSQLALGEYLNILHKKYAIVWTEDVPKTFEFLPGHESIQNIEKNPINPEEYDLILIVDSGDIDRIGETRKIIQPYHTVVNIDHHKANTRFGTINIVRDWAASIGEILYYFFKTNRIIITKEIAVHIYVSLVSDTGSFRYDSMHPGIHYIAAELLEKGIVPSDYNIYLTQNKSYPYIKFLALALDRMELLDDNSIAVSVLYHADFQQQGNDETDGIIEYLGMLQKVSVYILIKEKKPGFFTASLRSKHQIDVAAVAGHFHGGGHMRAAGCKTKEMDYQVFKNALVEKIREQMHQ